MSIARERAKTQQEVENIQNVYARQVREHEQVWDTKRWRMSETWRAFEISEHSRWFQVKISLTTESEALRQRLAEAQNGWLGAREESLRREEKLKQLENEVSLLFAKFLIDLCLAFNTANRMSILSVLLNEFGKGQLRKRSWRKSRIFQKTRRTARTTVLGNVTRDRAETWYDGLAHKPTCHARTSRGNSLELIEPSVNLVRFKISWAAIIFAVVELRQELEEMLHAQMKMSSALKDENKRLVSKLEDKKGNHRWIYCISLNFCDQEFDSCNVPLSRY